tara:strand:+ start:86631 stop:87137 length:507 start_codon:yes stop_codon:yes gene_type:complete
MDWQIKSISREDSATGQPFEIGQTALCLLFRNEEGYLERADLHPESAEDFNPPNPILGKWNRTVKSQVDEEKEAQKRQTATFEELFLSLFEEDTHTEAARAQEDVDLLKQILALQLERKRILKRLSTSPKATELHYIHPKTKAEFTFPRQDLSPEKLIILQEQLLHLC